MRRVPIVALLLFLQLAVGLNDHLLNGLGSTCLGARVRVTREPCLSASRHSGRVEMELFVLEKLCVALQRVAPPSTCLAAFITLAGASPPAAACTAHHERDGSTVARTDDTSAPASHPTPRYDALSTHWAPSRGRVL